MLEQKVNKILFWNLRQPEGECLTFPAETRSVRRCRLWWVQAEDGRTDLQRAHWDDARLRLSRHEDVRERGVCVPALQADRSAVRLPGAVSGRGGSAESSLGHCSALLSVSVGVLLPVRGPDPGRGGWVELLLHPHLRYNFTLLPSSLSFYLFQTFLCGPDLINLAWMVSRNPILWRTDNYAILQLYNLCWWFYKTVSLVAF